MTQNVSELIASVKSLLGGTAAFTAVNSLLGIILPLRMEAAGYPVALTGAIMAGYYLGLAFGGLRGKRVIFRIGHIRAFAVFAALTAATALAYDIFFHPIAWLILRIINGFCIAGLTATIESWLSTRSSNETRGRILSFYMLTFYLAVALGQTLVNLFDVGAPGVFMLAASLIVLSLIPVAMTSLEEPNLKDNRPLGIGDLFSASSVGTIGACVAGLMVGSFYALGVVFALKIGLSVSEAALFMSIVVLGSLVFQLPMGVLADRYDRRVVMSGALLVVGAAWGTLAGFVASGMPFVALLMVAFRGGDEQRLSALRRANLRPIGAQILYCGGRTFADGLFRWCDDRAASRLSSHGIIRPLELLSVRSDNRGPLRGDCSYPRLAASTLACA